MSDALARPSSSSVVQFSLRTRYTRIDCEEKDYEGLWAEVRTNLSHAERADFVESLANISVDGKDHFTRMLNAFTDAQKRQTDAELLVINASTDEEIESARIARATANDAVWNAQQELITANTPEIVSNREQHWSLIAPFVRAWNIYDAKEKPVPPPEKSGLAALPHIDLVISTWLTSTIERGYRGGKGVRTSASVSDDSPAPTSGPQLANGTEPSS